eukprot:11266579-Alexandrium_andersonii.AAC.1
MELGREVSIALDAQLGEAKCLAPGEVKVREHFAGLRHRVAAGAHVEPGHILPLEDPAGHA